MIRSIRHKGLKRLYEDDPRGWISESIYILGYFVSYIQGCTPFAMLGGRSSNRLSAHDPHEESSALCEVCVNMQKAHLIEVLYLVNQGSDEAVHGLQRLKKRPGFTEETYGDTLARLEHARAQVNLQFCDDMQDSEQKDAKRYEREQSKGGRKDSEPRSFAYMRVCIC